MPVAKNFAPVPEISPDERVRIFRSSFSATGEYEGMEVDACAIISERFVVIGDTLLCPADMAAMLQHLGDVLPGRQLLVINSHADWDHSWGNCYFSGEHAAPIIAHEHCRTRMLSAEAQEGVNEYQQRFTLFDQVVLQPPTLTFSHNFTIHGGDLTIQLIPSPGHHADHIAIWIPEISLLLAFDAAEKPLPLVESVQDMRRTLAHFIALNPQHVLCSHGKTTSIAIVKENLAYLHTLEQRCRSFLGSKQPTSEELDRLPELIHYPLDEVIAGSAEPVDRSFYGWAHANNARNMIQWLMGK